MAGIVDGLGGEEVNQSVSVQTGSVISRGIGSFAGNVHGADVWGTTSVSGASVAGDTISGVTVKAHDTTVVHISGGSFTDPYGRLRSTGINDATPAYGYRVLAGSVKTGNDNSGLIVFPTLFADNKWHMTITPAEFTNAYKYIADGSQFPPMISGAKRASGCWMVGGSITVYDWIAVGL